MKPLLKQRPQPKLTAYEKIDYLQIVSGKFDAILFIHQNDSLIFVAW